MLISQSDSGAWPSATPPPKRVAAHLGYRADQRNALSHAP